MPLSTPSCLAFTVWGVHPKVLCRLQFCPRYAIMYPLRISEGCFGLSGSGRGFIVLLGVIYLSFLALGMDAGAFSVAWPDMRLDFGLPLEIGGTIVAVQMIFYVIASSQTGGISRYIRLEKLAFIGLMLMAAGYFAFAFAPSFIALMVILSLVGLGTGMIDSSINTYGAQILTTGQLSLVHCFWGAGASLTPIVMAQLIIFSGWRLGYTFLAVFALAVAVVVLVSILLGLWRGGESVAAVESGGHTGRWPNRLAKKRHQALRILTCFIYGGAEHAIGFWITTVLVESRGLSIDAAGMFPAAYYGAIMLGRVLCGLIDRRARDTTMVRLGLVVGLVGVGVLAFTGNIAGIALVGLGFSPIFPCLIHDTAERFTPEVTGKLIGYQVATFGVSVVVLSPLVGHTLAAVSIHSLFPIMAVLIILTFAANEWLEVISAKIAG